MSWDPTTPTTNKRLHCAEMIERIEAMREGFAEYLESPMPEFQRAPKPKKRDWYCIGLEGPMAGLP